MKFKDYLREIRIKDNLTQNSLAELLGISLAAVKKIEAGSTEYPSSKVLESLAKFLNKSQVEVIQDILFENDELIKYEERERKSIDILQKYVSLLFLEGWNLTSYLPNIGMEKIEEECFGAELASKRTPSNNMLVDTTYKYFVDMSDIKGILSSLLVTMMLIKKKVKVYSIVFDANDKKDLKVYNELKSINVRNFKVKIKVVLFDKIKCEVLEEKNMCSD